MSSYPNMRENTRVGLH